MNKANKVLWSVIGGLSLSTIVLLFLLLMNLSSSEPSHSKLGDAEGRLESNKVIAQIGDVQITLSDLHDDLVRSYGAELLNQLLNNHAIRIEAESLGISVSKLEIETELQAMSVGYDSMDEYYLAMKKQLGLSQADLYKDAEYKLLLDKIATRNITITDRQVDDYIKTHKDEFKVRKEFHIQQMILASQEHADKALKELNKGETFAILVRDRSIDDTTASNGGDLGWVMDDDPFIHPEVLEAASKLRSGKLSGIIELNNGNYAIIKLLDQRTVAQEDEAVTKEKVRKQLALQNALPIKEVVQELRKKHGSVILDNRFLP